MKKFFLICVAFTGICLQNCQAQTTKTEKPAIFGKVLSQNNSISAAQLPALLASKDSVAVKVTGQVLDVCQAKGCWMDIKLSNNEVMKVRFKDYGFFVPKDIAGKTVTMNGMAYNKIISVADQQHYAQDAGKSKAEINAITQPKSSITFTADGVLIK